MRRIKISTTIIGTLFFLSAYAQDAASYRFKTIDNFNGLPNNSVWQIESDDLGFIWVATVDGLCRLETDNRIKVFRNEEYPELKSSNIRALKSDSRGNLWIGTRHSGLTLYNLNTGEWKSYNHDEKNPKSLVDDQILTITEDSKGNIWIGTENGLSIYSYETNSFESYLPDVKNSTALQSKAILEIYVDDKGRVWIGTWGSGMYLALFDEKRNLNQIEFKQIKPIERKADTYNVWTISQDQEGRFWIGSFGGGLFYMTLPDMASDITGQQDWNPDFLSFYYDINRDALSDNNITDVIEDNNGDLWISTTNGLNHIVHDNIDKLLNLDNKANYETHITKIMYDPNKPNSIPYGTIYSLEVDDQGLIWISTTGGVGIYNPRISQFVNYSINPSFDNTLFSKNLYVNDNKESWITGYGHGLSIYNHKTRSSLTYKEYFGKNFNHGTVLSIHHDKNKLYITTKRKLVIHDLKDNSESIIDFDDELRNVLDVFTLVSTYLDSKGRFYLGTTNGIIVFDIKSNSYNLLTNNALDENSIVDNSITDILEDSNGNIWISTYNGLSKVIEISGLEYRFTNYRHNSEVAENSISSNQIVCMTEVNKVLYFGLSSGISSYNLETQKFKRVTGQGENYYIQSIIDVGGHTLWAGTMDGIISVDIASGNVKLYNEDDGLLKNKYIPLGIDVDKNEHVYFTTINSIIEIDPKLIQKNDEKPPVYVTDIKVLSSEGDRYYSGYEIDDLELGSNDYYVSFNFAALNYIHSQKNKYAYRLEGFEDKWNYPDKNITTAIYTNLDHGNYKLQVKACNNDGIWNEEGYTLPITIKPALTETRFFKFISILLSLLTVFGCFLLYTNNVRRRNAEMEQLVSERTEELADKNRQVEDLLTKIQFRNSELEVLVAQRTENLLEANNDLKRSNSDLEQFAYVASHDLQEPLRTIGTFTGLLGRKLKDNLDEASQEYITFIVDGVSRMSNLIQSILTYSSVGKELSISRQDLNQIVNSKVKDLSKRVDEKNAKISIGELPVIYCDGAQIGMVFYNLINNGLKFNKQDIPIISIDHISIDSEYHKFSVKDNGIGIKEEYQSKIFELFNRLHLKSEYEGTGIGLALCERIITKHNGKIWLESEEGVGTTFYFTISKNITRGS